MSGSFLAVFIGITVALVAMTGAMIACGLRFAGLGWRRAWLIGLVVPAIGAVAAWLLLAFQLAPPHP